MKNKQKTKLWSVLHVMNHPLFTESLFETNIQEMTTRL